MNDLVKVTPLVLVVFLINEHAFAVEKIDVLTTISLGRTTIDLDIAETLSTQTGIFDGDSRDNAVNPSIPGAEL